MKKLNSTDMDELADKVRQLNQEGALTDEDAENLIYAVYHPSGDESILKKIAGSPGTWTAIAKVLELLFN